MEKLTAAILTILFSVAIVLIPIFMRLCRFSALATIVITLLGALVFGFRGDVFLYRGAVAIALFVLAELGRRLLIWIAPSDTTVIT